MSQPLKPLEKAIEIAGSQSALARAMSIYLNKKLRQSHISLWLHGSKKGVPAEYCAAIEQLTNGAVSAIDLRPDIFPPSQNFSNQNEIHSSNAGGGGVVRFGF